MVLQGLAAAPATLSPAPAEAALAWQEHIRPKLISLQLTLPEEEEDGGDKKKKGGGGGGGKKGGGGGKKKEEKARAGHLRPRARRSDEAD